MLWKNFYFVQQCLGMAVFWMGMPKMKQLCQLRGLPSEITALLKLFYILDTKVFFLALQKTLVLLREFSVKCSENSLCCKPINSCREGWETQQPLEIYSPSARLNLVSSGQDYIEKILCTTFFCVQATALHTVAKSINCIFEKKN